MQQGYKTKQKDTLLEFFESNANQCFSSRQVLEALKDTASAATVYRHLAALTEKGILTRFVGDGDKNIYYQLAGALDCHFHFKCTRCHKLYHSDCDLIKQLYKHIEQHHKFYVDNTRTLFYGLCTYCTEEEL